MIKKLLFVAMAILMAMSFSSCKKKINLKKIDGTWTVESINYSSTNVNTYSKTIADSMCANTYPLLDKFTVGCTKTETTTITVTGNVLSASVKYTPSGDCLDSLYADELYNSPIPPVSRTNTYGGSLAMTITITEEGTYTTNVTYDGTCTVIGIRPPSSGVDISGTMESAANTWYADDNTAGKNSVFTFVDFPIPTFLGSFPDYSGMEGGVDTLGVTCGDISFNPSFAIFRVEKEDKDNLTLTFEDFNNDTKQTIDDNTTYFYNPIIQALDSINCVVTENNPTSNKVSLVLKLTRS